MHGQPHIRFITNNVCSAQRLKDTHWRRRTCIQIVFRYQARFKNGIIIMSYIQFIVFLYAKKTHRTHVHFTDEL